MSDSRQDFDSQLIFLLGVPRSGTTLLQTHFSRHSDIFSYSESFVLLNLIFSLRGGLDSRYYESQAAWFGLDDLLSRTEGGRQSYLGAVRAFTAELYQSCLRRSPANAFSRTRRRPTS